VPLLDAAASVMDWSPRSVNCITFGRFSNSSLRTAASLAHVWWRPN